MERQWNRLAYRLRSELPDPAREERRLAELHGDVARVAQRVEVRPRVQPGELLEVDTTADDVIVVGVFVSEVVGRRGRGRGVDGRVGQSWKTRECCIISLLANSKLLRNCSKYGFLQFITKEHQAMYRPPRRQTKSVVSLCFLGNRRI